MMKYACLGNLVSEISAGGYKLQPICGADF
jgi:hypothetical protein